MLKLVIEILKDKRVNTCKQTITKKSKEAQT